MTDTGKYVAKAALLLMITVVISRILGYGREVAMVTLFGTNYLTDAYRAAFSIPDFLYLLLVGGGLSSAFIPVFSSAVAMNKEDEGWHSASIVFNYTILFLLVLIGIGYIYTKPLVILLVPGLPPESIQMAVGMTHIMFIQCFFMALNGFAMGILNSYNQFTGPAIGSLVYNLVIIVVGVAFAKTIGIQAFAWGVVLGAILNFAVQIPALRRVGMKYTPSFDFRDPGFRQIMLLMVPVIAGLGVVQFNLFVTQNLSSGLGGGTVTSLNLAQKVMNLPIGIFATSIATAVFPTMTALAARGELAQFKRTTSLGTRAIFLVTIPAAAGLIAISEPLIKLLFLQGKVTASAAETIGQALAYYCIGLFAYSAINVLNRSFYALKDTLTPVVASAITIGVNVYLSMTLMKTMNYQGLALAYSLAGIVNLIVLFGVLRWKIGQLGASQILKSLVISFGASAVMYFAVRQILVYSSMVLNMAPKLEELIGVTLAISIGIVVYGGLVYIFKLEESELVINMVKRRLGRGNPA